MLSLGYHHTGFYRLYEGNQPRYTFRINLKENGQMLKMRCLNHLLSLLKEVRLII